MVVQRFTFFQIPKSEDVQEMVQQYRKLNDTAVRDGKPYILSCEADGTVPDPRSKGYTLAVRTSFSSLDDMKYYDNDCAAHKALKAFAAPRRTGDVLVFFLEK